MIKLATRIVSLLAAVLVGYWLLKPMMVSRVVEHFNSCHDELHIAERMKATDAEERDKLLDDYRECVLGKTRFFDPVFFGRKDIDKSIDPIRLMNPRPD